MNNTKGAVLTVVLVVMTLVGSALVGYGFKRLNSQTVAVETVKVEVKQENKDVDSKTKKILQLDLSDKQIIPVYGPIGYGAYSVAKKIIQMSKNGKPIYLLINSPGGSVLDGALIVSAIEGSTVPVYTICEQLCASMSYIIHQYGHKRMMVDRSLLMAHPASGGLSGTLEQMQSRLTTIQRYVNKFNAYIAKRTNLNLEKYQNMTVSEYWIDAEDATDQNFNDMIVNVNLDNVSSDSELSEDLRRKNNIKERIDLKW